MGAHRSESVPSVDRAETWLYEPVCGRYASSAQRGVYGIDELSTFNIAEQFETARTEAEEFIEVGDRVVTPLVGHYRGRDGIEVTARFTYLWSIRDGAGVRVTLYQEREEALEAAVLSE